LSGLTGPLDLGSADARFSGEAANDDAGVSVSGAGDVNGDGNHDLLIAASDQDDGADRGGAIYRILSPVSGAIDLGDSDARYLCEARGGYAGWGLSDAGDLNGDGLGDAIIGAYGVDLDGSDDGESYIVLGRGL